LRAARRSADAGRSESARPSAKKDKSAFIYHENGFPEK